MSKEFSLKVGDKVKHKTLNKAFGTVKEIRNQIGAKSALQEKQDEQEIVTVTWDNGTVSYVSPKAIEAAA